MAFGEYHPHRRVEQVAMEAGQPGFTDTCYSTITHQVWILTWSPNQPLAHFMKKPLGDRPSAISFEVFPEILFIFHRVGGSWVQVLSGIEVCT